MLKQVQQKVQHDSKRLCYSNHSLVASVLAPRNDGEEWKIPPVGWDWYCVSPFDEFRVTRH